ncbi:sporulation protein YtxC [Halobacillus salinus]|uniref:Sporulation protein YtxC n=1 Tax=Halobacillus salinus TaxID=192814 RepID=A0A4Z0H4G9_9BACI|nr:sporulation protein YtxC [Halobacillus salinus]TGB04095.1 hypothetical protein E4663_03545 [Halobacillus salinus]
MVCVHFSKEKEARYFYNIVVRESKRWRLQMDTYDVYLEEGDVCKKTFTEMVHACMELILARKWLGWIEGVLRHRYHFNEEQEIQRILEIGQQFEAEAPKGLVLPPVLDLIRATVEDELRGKWWLHFDDLSVSCLQTVHSELVEYTGFLIDEYKQEESYQLLLDSWRQRVHQKDTGVQRIHLLDQDGWRYFHDEGNRIRPSETDLYLRLYPDDSIIDLPESWCLTPALVHAPNELIIYSDDREGSSFELLQNIFEEKVVWRNTAEFPFEIA